MKKQRTVDEYIESFPKVVGTQLKKVRETIRGVLPMGEEAISYGIPAFKIDGKNLIYFAGWKEHISIYPIPPGSDQFNKKIVPFVKGKGTLQFQLDKPIPLNLVKEIVKFSLKWHVEKYNNKM